MTDFFDFQNLVPTFGASASGPRYRLGTVVSVNDNRTITVTVAGSTGSITNIKYLGNVQPIPGIGVWLVSDGLDIFAFGVIAGNDRTFSPRASRSTDQNIGDSTDTAVSFDAVNSDAWSAWSAGSPTRLTARLTGRYIAVGQATFAGNATGFRGAWIERTGTATTGRQYIPSVGAGNPTWVNVTSQPIDMTAGNDYIRLIVRQNSGGTLAITNSSTYSPSLSLIYLGP